MKIGIKVILISICNCLFVLNSIFCLADNAALNKQVNQELYIPTAADKPRESYSIISSNNFFGIKADCASEFGSANPAFKNLKTEEALSKTTTDSNIFLVRRYPNWKEMHFSYTLLPGFLRQPETIMDSYDVNQRLYVELVYFPTTTNEMLSPTVFKRVNYKISNKEIDSSLLIEDPNEWFDQNNSAIQASASSTSYNKVPTLTLSGFFYRFVIANPLNSNIWDPYNIYLSSYENNYFENLCKRLGIPYIKGLQNINKPVKYNGLVKVRFPWGLYPRREPKNWKYLGHYDELIKKIKTNKLLISSFYYEQPHIGRPRSFEPAHVNAPNSHAYLEYIENFRYIQYREIQYMVPVDTPDIQKLLDALYVDVNSETIDKVLTYSFLEERSDRRDSIHQSFAKMTKPKTRPFENSQYKITGIATDKDSITLNGVDITPEFCKKVTSVFQFDPLMYDWELDISPQYRKKLEKTSGLSSYTHNK